MHLIVSVVTPWLGQAQALKL